MIEINKIYNENCLDFMKRFSQENQKIDIIITSPPYGNSTKVSDKCKERDLTDTAHGSHMRYQDYDDDMSEEEYLELIKNVFNGFNSILKKDGVILYNFSYATKSVKNTKMFIDVLNMINHTEFIICDIIVWQKPTALPIQAHNKLSRTCEPVFVICRKDEFHTFKANKRISCVVNKTPFYDYVPNHIYAKNNDGVTTLNRATFSTDLVLQLLKLYCYSKDCIVYDPFMGTGTTANACIKYGCHYLGTELSKAQCEYAENRLQKTLELVNMSEDW